MTPERQALKTSIISTSGLLRTLFSPPYRPTAALSPRSPANPSEFRRFRRIGLCFSALRRFRRSQAPRFRPLARSARQVRVLKTRFD